MNKYDKPMMETAYVWAQQSYCKRNQVGAVLSKYGRIISIGYNGTISGADNCCEEEKDGKVVSKNTVVHAEANALMFAARHGIETDGCVLYVTLSPCVECAKMIIQSGITRVIFGNLYRLSEGVEFLKEHGIEVIQYEDDYLSWN